MVEQRSGPDISPEDRTRRRRFLGDFLLAHGAITQEQLAKALDRQRADKTGHGRLGHVLVEMGYVTEVQVCEAIAEQLQIPAADLVAVDVPPEVLSRLHKELAIRLECLPWFIDGKDLYVIMSDPTNVASIDAIGFATGLRVRPVVAPESEVAAAIKRFYSAEETSLAQFEDVDLLAQMSVVAEVDREAPTDEATIEGALAPPVVKLVSAILADAVRSGASDIHIEPQDREMVLRYRVDGLLRQVMRMPKRIQAKVISRIKIMSHMDIAERRRPQDGRARIIVGVKAFDLRVSSLPTADGEKIVIRILVQDRAQVALAALGFAPDTLETFQAMLRRPQGMILVTGPTGSGKTSTLYAALNAVKGETVNVVTIEDPVEYRLPGVSQVAVTDRSGLTFAAGLRSILRQDPDVIMVGEIRDPETAQVAFQAAQTGHLVLSTLHTNDAASAATRLLEIGVPAYVVASSVIAIMAQRLMRRLCDCKTTNADGTASPKGCEACRFGGFRGRIATYELLRFTPRVRSVVLAHGSEDDIRAAGLASGMHTLFEDGERKVAEGITVLEEVRRVAPPDELTTPMEIPPAAASPLLPPLAPEARQRRRSRILVVEDDDAYREILRETLEGENYEVLQAANGEEALALVYRQSPDVVLTDLHMPGMDGMELLRRLRGDLATRQIPVLFLTVIDAVGTEVQALDVGADDYITKPIERGRLLSRIRRSLFRARIDRAGL